MIIKTPFPVFWPFSTPRPMHRQWWSTNVIVGTRLTSLLMVYPCHRRPSASLNPISRLQLSQPYNAISTVSGFNPYPNTMPQKVQNAYTKSNTNTTEITNTKLCQPKYKHNTIPAHDILSAGSLHIQTSPI